MRKEYAKCINKTITDYTWNKEELILFFDDGSWILFQPYGDCCSKTWIEDIDTPFNLTGVVYGIEDIDMLRPPQNEEYEYLQFYGLKIITSAGHTVVEYRNSSNGYYGGQLIPYFHENDDASNT